MIQTRPSVNYAKDRVDQLFLSYGMVWSEKGCTYGCDHYRAVNNNTLCRFSVWWQPNIHLNNRVILLQACSWPVRRQSFAKIPKRKEGRKRRFPYFIPSRPSKSFVFGEGEVIQDLDLHFTDHHRNIIIIMRRWWKDEVGRGGKKNITPSRCGWWNIFASSPGKLLKAWWVVLVRVISVFLHKENTSFYLRRPIFTRFEIAAWWPWLRSVLSI